MSIQRLSIETLGQITDHALLQKLRLTLDEMIQEEIHAVI